MRDESNSDTPSHSRTPPRHVPQRAPPLRMANAPAAAAPGAAAPPRAPSKPPSVKVLVDEYVRAHEPDSRGHGRTSRACALRAETLAELAALQWQLLLIVGETGSGKSLTLAQLCEFFRLSPDETAALHFELDRAIVSHPGFASPNYAVERLGLVGASRVEEDSARAAARPLRRDGRGGWGLRARARMRAAPRRAAKLPLTPPKPTAARCCCCKLTSVRRLCPRARA
jgi:hypothetical protein